MDALTRANAQAVRRMFGYGLSTLAISRLSGQSQKTVRGYLRLAYAEPPESRLLWHRAWRAQVRAARIHLTRYWREKHRTARTADAKANVQREYTERKRELELQV